MNAPLASPGLLAGRPRISVIGAGPGGLAIAMVLAAQGARVTVHEKATTVGGRTRSLRTPEGFTFDLGPTFFLYPRILQEIFEACGGRLEDEVELKRIDPLYRLVFEGAASIDATADETRMAAEIAKICPADADGFSAFMAENRRKLAAFRPVLEKPFGNRRRFLHPEVLRSVPLLKPHTTVDRDLARHFSDPRIRLAFSFQTKYLGMSPFRCPSLSTILSFLEYEHGVWHPIGGCGAVSEAMGRMAERLGAEIRLGEAVEAIAYEGRRAVGVEAGGRRHAADAVVINGDFAKTVPQLVPDALRRQWPDRKIAQARYSCSTFMLYLGIEGTLPLAHHTVLLSEDYRRNIHQIEVGEMPDAPSLYAQYATGTDPSLAPPGHSTLYVLVPVPNMRDAAEHGFDWSTETPRIRALAMRRLAEIGLPDIESRIRYERIVTPADWRDSYDIGFGATFNLSHDLGNMLCFRPRNRFAEIEGLYLVGGGTHPGSGLPVIYEGARITAGLLAKDLGLRGMALAGDGIGTFTPALGATRS